MDTIPREEAGIARVFHSMLDFLGDWFSKKVDWLHDTYIQLILRTNTCGKAMGYGAQDDHWQSKRSKNSAMNLKTLFLCEYLCILAKTGHYTNFVGLQRLQHNFVRHMGSGERLYVTILTAHVMKYVSKFSPNATSSASEPH